MEVDLSAQLRPRTKQFAGKEESNQTITAGNPNIA
jgi:hypothetical protein